MANAFDSNYKPGNARELVNSAKAFEKNGQFDRALTDYRKAALADPKDMEALLGVGRLCRSLGDTNPSMARYSLEAFRKAAYLDLNNEQAHQHYITAVQKNGEMDALLKEYDGLIKKNPDNENLKKCRKNILSISMAMIPKHSTMGGSDFSTRLRKLLLFFCIGGLLFGGVLIVSPAFLRKSEKFTKEQLQNFFRIGLILSGASALGLVSRSFIK